MCRVRVGWVAKVWWGGRAMIMKQVLGERDVKRTGENEEGLAGFRTWRSWTPVLWIEPYHRYGRVYLSMRVKGSRT